MSLMRKMRRKSNKVKRKSLNKLLIKKHKISITMKIRKYNHQIIMIKKMTKKENKTSTKIMKVKNNNKKSTKRKIKNRN